MGRRFSLAALAALGLPALLLSGWLIYSRSAFGTCAPTAQPDRISYCGRTYLPGEHVSRAIIDSTGNGPGVFSFRQVGSTAGRTPFFASTSATDMPSSGGSGGVVNSVQGAGSFL